MVLVELSVSKASRWHMGHPARQFEQGPAPRYSVFRSVSTTNTSRGAFRISFIPSPGGRHIIHWTSSSYPPKLHPPTRFTPTSINISPATASPYTYKHQLPSLPPCNPKNNLPQRQAHKQQHVHTPHPINAPLVSTHCDKQSFNVHGRRPHIPH
jgi:hypothetical protein